MQPENVIEDNKKLETDKFSLKGILSSLVTEKNKIIVLLNDAIDAAEQSKVYIYIYTLVISSWLFSVAFKQTTVIR